MEHRIGDKRIIRLIQKWLKAGILEDGVVTVSDRGTGQGSVISPLLANIYLHYVFDLWAERWRRREATGDMIIVRYADDLVLGFQHESDARRFLDAMRAEVRGVRPVAPSGQNPSDRVRPPSRRQARASAGWQTGDLQFPGVHLICGRSRRGTFLLKRKTRRDRMRAKLEEIKEELRRRMHWPIPEQGRWLAQVIRGFFAYHAVPTNIRGARQVQAQVTRIWLRTLRRRSQKEIPVDADGEAGRGLPSETQDPSSLAERAFRRQTPEVGAGCLNWARPDLCGGRGVTRVPTAILRARAQSTICTHSRVCYSEEASLVDLAVAPLTQPPFCRGPNERIDRRPAADPGIQHVRSRRPSRSS